MDQYRVLFDKLCSGVGRMIHQPALRRHANFDRLERIYVFMCNDTVYDLSDDKASLHDSDIDNVSRWLMRKALKAWNDELLYNVRYEPIRRPNDEVGGAFAH